MKTNQIYNILGIQDSCTSPNFLGVFPSDMLVAPHQNKQFIVCNLDGHKFKGSHWVCIYLEKRGGGYIGEYFCSFGQYPRVLKIENYLNKHCTSWVWNKKQIQHELSNTCGHHVIYFLANRCRGYSMQAIISHLLYSYNPDVTVYNFVLSNYSIKS